MEVAVIWFLSMIAMGSEINNQQAQIDQLSEEVELNNKWIHDLENWNDDQDQAIIELQVQHAAAQARRNVMENRYNRRLDAVEGKTDFLDRKMIELHN